MQLLPHIKEGVRVQKGFIDQRPLTSLQQFRECISQRFGPTDLNYSPFIGHSGEDYVYNPRTENFGSHSGTGICKEEKDAQGNFVGFGRYIEIFNTELGIKTYYAHLDEFVIKSGDHVEAGQLIAYGDSTGRSTASHSHFQLKRIDKNGAVIDYNNGYGGAIDPSPYWVWYNSSMGKLVRANKDIYRLKDGVKDLFLNKKSFEVLDGRWGEVVSISQSELDAIPDGSVLIAVPNE